VQLGRRETEPHARTEEGSVVKAFVVYESLWGSTTRIARAIALAKVLA
jgi:hypothetical protein